MGLRPDYRIVANDADVTMTIAARFVALRITDEAGLQSDLLELVLADHDPEKPIIPPAKGAELEVFLGYEGALSRMGLYVFDEYELAGWPGTMTIRARAAVYEGTTKGKTDLQTQKVRSWPDKTKLADMVAKIAKEHGLEPAVAPSLAGIVLPHFDQTEESDISFLLRILKNYDALVKPAGGKLVVIKRGELKTSGGADLPRITLQANDASAWRYTNSARDSAGTVVAYWHSKRTSKRNQITIGEGEPVYRIRHYFPTEAAAIKAAQAMQDKRKRGQETFYCDMPGNAMVSAETLLTAAGFRPGVDGGWLIKRVEHALDSGGYSTRIEAEKPNEADADE